MFSYRLVLGYFVPGFPVENSYSCYKTLAHKKTQDWVFKNPRLLLGFRDSKKFPIEVLQGLALGFPVENSYSY